MKNDLPKTLLEAVRYFSDLDVCNELMTEIKWPKGTIICPKCGADRQYLEHRIDASECDLAAASESLELSRALNRAELAAIKSLTEQLADRDRQIEAARQLISNWRVTANCLSDADGDSVHRQLLHEHATQLDAALQQIAARRQEREGRG